MSRSACEERGKVVLALGPIWRKRWICTKDIRTIKSRFCAATCWRRVNSVKRAFPHIWQTQLTFRIYW